MTDEELKAEAIEWAKRQPDFPKAQDWVINRYESDPPPYSSRTLKKLFGSYNNFRRACEAEILKHDPNEPVTLDVLKQDCIVDEQGCWIWQKSTEQDGYAKKGIGGKNWRVHKYVHEVLGNNPKPDTKNKYTVDHKCQVTSCINPEHLRWATASDQAKNQTRGKKYKQSVSPPKSHSCLEERLNWYLSQCEVDANGCMIPPNKPTGTGYVTIEYIGRNKARKVYRLHILSALQKDNHPLNQEYYESFTPNHEVLHKCPVTKPDKRCCNPEHLKIVKGAEARRENALDTRDYHSGYRLKHKEIPEIREIFLDCLEQGWNKNNSYRHIASIYEVSADAIGDAVRGTRKWKDVE